MPEFLQLLPPGEALELLLGRLPRRSPQIEEVETARALGRVTALPVLAPEDLPAFARSTVDGYALQAKDTFGASDSLPAYLALRGECPMGSAPGFSLDAGQAALIHTGGMLPGGADAVVMLEYTQAARSAEVEVMRAVSPGENVVHPGEDVRRGDEVLPAGARLRPAEIGGLMALGVTNVSAARKPLVGILSSGDEVVAPQETPQPGQVRDVNSYTLSALVEQSGAASRLYGIIPDRAKALRATLAQALSQCDLVVITAGSSASTRDLTASVIAEMGLPGVLAHGVNVRPGKPTILAVCGEKPVIGLPGNPVSALVIAGLFVIPVISALLGLRSHALKAQVTAQLTANLPSQAGREDWVPVRLLRDGERWLAEPIFYKSNLIFTLARADGLLHIPADANGIEAGTQADVFLME